MSAHVPEMPSGERAADEPGTVGSGSGFQVRAGCDLFAQQLARWLVLAGGSRAALWLPRVRRTGLEMMNR